MTDLPRASTSPISRPQRAAPLATQLLVAIAGAAIFVVFVLMTAFTAPSRRFDVVSESQPPTNSELIDSLAELDSFGVGYYPWTDSADFFLAVDEPSDYLHVYDELPEFAVPIRQLVERGADAIPELCAHLDDGRTTNIGVRTEWSPEERTGDRPDRHRVWLAAWLYHGNDYDARYKYSRWDLPDKIPPPRQHWVTVGDLCYVAIGQIVNRDFDVFEYGHENGADVLSPTSRPELARAVRRDWGGLTEKGHRESLIRDALQSRRTPSGNQQLTGAVRRLWYYYPDAAEDVLHTLLSRRVYNASRAIDFVYASLLRSTAAGNHKKLFEAYMAENGETEAVGVVATVHEHLLELREDIADAEESVRHGQPVSINGVPFDRNHDLYGELEKTTSIFRELVPLVGGREELATVVSNDEHFLIFDTARNFASPDIDRILCDVMSQDDDGSTQR